MNEGVAPAMGDETNNTGFAPEGNTSQPINQIQPVETTTDFSRTPEGPMAYAKLFTGVEDLVKEDKLLGKYQNVGEFAKAYKELQTSYMKAQNDLKSAQEGKSNVPEEYDYKEAVEKAGLEFQDEEQFKAVLGTLKEQGFTQDQFNTLMGLAGDFATGLLANMGPGFDLQAEAARLEKSWGNEKEARTQAAFNFAKNVIGIPPVVWNNSIIKSAEAMEWVYSLSQKFGNSNPQPLNETPAARTTVTKGDIDAAMNDPRYWGTQSVPENAQYQDKVRGMIAAYIQAGGTV